MPPETSDSLTHAHNIEQIATCIDEIVRKQGEVLVALRMIVDVLRADRLGASLPEDR